MNYLLRENYLTTKPLTLNLKWNLNLRILIIPFFILTLAILIFYILQVNKIAADRYLIKEEEGKISRLLEENKILEINSNQATSLKNIDEIAKEFGFEKVNRIKYIRILETSMAAK